MAFFIQQNKKLIMNAEKIRITKRFSFEMGHALNNYDGKCRFLHGHSYKLYVTILGHIKNELDAPKDGMVIDFSTLKQIVNDEIIEVYDHSFVVNKNDKRKFSLPDISQRTILFEVQPTCENLLVHFKNIVIEKLPKDLQLVNMKLYETENSFAEWDINDQA